MEMKIPASGLVSSARAAMTSLAVKIYALKVRATFQFASKADCPCMVQRHSFNGGIYFKHE